MSAASIKDAARSSSTGCISLSGTFVLIAATGVMVGSFRNLSRQPRGILTDKRLEFQITLAAPRYAAEQSYTAVVRSALDRLQQVPGIISTAATPVDPFEGQREFASFNVEGKPAPDPPGYYYALRDGWSLASIPVRSYDVCPDGRYFIVPLVEHQIDLPDTR